MKQLRWCVIRNNIYLGKLLRAKWLDLGNGSFTGTLLARELVSDHLLSSFTNGEDLTSPHHSFQCFHLLGTCWAISPVLAELVEDFRRCWQWGEVMSE